MLEQVIDRLIGCSITASYLIIGIIAIRWIFKDVSKIFHKSLWGLVAIRLICPFKIRSIFSILPKHVENVTLKSISDEISSNEFIRSVKDFGFTSARFAESTEKECLLPDNPDMLVIVWIFGAVMTGIYFMIILLRFRSVLRESVRIDTDIYVCDRIRNSFVCGLVKPKIYISYDTSSEQMNDILSHERMHIKKGDHVWKPLACMLVTVYWFNPIIWLACALFFKDIEYACDEAVISKLSFKDRKHYANTLFECGIKSKPMYSYPLAFGEIGIKERIEMIMNYKKTKIWLMVLAMVACLALCVGCMTNPTDEADSADEESGVNPPILQDLESFDSIIDSLEPGQFYAFADMDAQNDALLVTSYTYDNLDGNIAAIDAVIYGFDADGNIVEYGDVSSQGTAYPLACKDGCLYFGGNHYMAKVYIDETKSAIITKEEAYETFDEVEEGTPEEDVPVHYYWASYDEAYDGEVEDDAHLVNLYDEYGEAIVINFIAVE